MPLQTQAIRQEGIFDKEQWYQLCFCPKIRDCFVKGLWLQPSHQHKCSKLTVFLKWMCYYKAQDNLYSSPGLTTDNRAKNLCIDVIWEAKGHFFFLKGKKNNCPVDTRQRSQRPNGLLNCIPRV